jgi:hypothetical protein
VSDQLERYVAALLGCALAATWAAAGATAALIALAAATACYLAAAALQRGSLKRLLAAFAHDLSGLGSRRKPPVRARAAARPRSRPAARRGATAARRPRRAPARRHDEALSEAPLAPAGPYGW